MKTPFPTPDQWRGKCAEMRRAIDRLEADGPELLRRGKYLMRDGYPTASMGGGSGKGAGDPVGEIVVANAMSDPVRHNIETMIRLVDSAVADLRIADGARGRAVPPADTNPELKRESLAPICVNPFCDDLALWKDRTTPKAGRCPGCYDFKRVHGRERTEADRRGRQAS